MTPQNSYQRFLLPLLNRLSPETAHTITYAILRCVEQVPGGIALLQKLSSNTPDLQDPRLAITFNHLHFDSPLMLASGWDKKGLCLHSLHALGFSAIEVGGVTLEPQYGNAKPRIFRIAPGVWINQCGFDSPGAEAVRNNLIHQARSFPIGISLGKNKHVALEDTSSHYAAIIDLLQPCGDYFVINVSSPNTQGLRDLQSRSKLIDIIQAIRCEKPLFIKISPDLSLEALDEMIDVALAYGITGLIATNSTIDTSIKAEYGAHYEKLGGGLSGANMRYRARTTEFCRHIDRQSQGKLIIIGCGGVDSTEAVLEKITAGANLVQIMTGLSAKGPTLVNRIRRELIQWMNEEKIKHISECRGKIEYLERWRGRQINP